MACLLQPECNFLNGYFRCWLLLEVVDVEVKITSMQGTHIFWRDRTQLITCTLWSTRLRSHLTRVKKMRTFLEVEGKMGPIPPQPVASIGLLSQTQTLMSGRIKPWRREKGQHPPKGLGLTQPLGLVKQPCTHPQQFLKPQSMSNPKQMFQKIDPHP